MTDIAKKINNRNQLNKEFQNLKKYRKKDIVNFIYKYLLIEVENHQISKKVIKNMLDEVIEYLKEKLADDYKIVLLNFGTFFKTKKKGKKGVKLKSGKRINILPYYDVIFKITQLNKRKINEELQKILLYGL